MVDGNGEGGFGGGHFNLKSLGGAYPSGGIPGLSDFGLRRGQNATKQHGRDRRICQGIQGAEWCINRLWTLLGILILLVYK